jgi:hypothetical protein
MKPARLKDCISASRATQLTRQQQRTSESSQYAKGQRERRSRRARGRRGNQGALFGRVRVSSRQLDLQTLQTFLHRPAMISREEGLHHE